MPAAVGFATVSLEPDPAIEAYKKDVDRTLIRENLKLSVDQRVRKMLSALGLAEEIRRASKDLERIAELEAIREERGEG
jgi:hypothetical protein